MHSGFSRTPFGRGAEGPDGSEPMPSTYLIWSILVTVFCCFIPGIIAIIFSSMVSSKYYAGDIEGSRRASRQAEIWIIVSVVLGVLAATLYLPFMLIGG
ncbi:MAG: CD225/dispanin family protein [Muribaculaceae bacterium]|nr:CD225/dispanin family protein [Muribaculaceae bacterium]